jgi:hypothetical protein
MTPAPAPPAAIWVPYRDEPLQHPRQRPARAALHVLPGLTLDDIELNHDEKTIFRTIGELENWGWAKRDAMYVKLVEARLRERVPVQVHWRRGDVIELGDPSMNYRNHSKFMFDGRQVIALNKSIDDYGSVSACFMVPTEFPAYYWQDRDGEPLITHNTVVPIDPRFAQAVYPKLLADQERIMREVAKGDKDTTNASGIFHVHFDGQDYAIINDAMRFCSSTAECERYLNRDVDEFNHLSYHWGLPDDAIDDLLDEGMLDDGSYYEVYPGDAGPLRRVPRGNILHTSLY